MRTTVRLVTYSASFNNTGIVVWSLVECLQLFFISCQEISPLLSMEAMAFVTEERKPAQESTFPNTYTFDLFGGVDVSDLWLLITVSNAIIV